MLLDFPKDVRDSSLKAIMRLVVNPKRDALEQSRRLVPALLPQAVGRRYLKTFGILEKLTTVNKSCHLIPVLDVVSATVTSILTSKD